MLLDDLLDRARLLILTGKGGVGKSTVTRAIAERAGERGRPVLTIEVAEPPDRVSGGSHTALRPDDALAEWLTERGLGPIARRLTRTGSLEVIARAIPGIRDLVTMAKVKQTVRDHPDHLVVLDAPASGHARSMLASVIEMAATMPGGALRQQADDVVALLHDAEQCVLVLVTLAAATPISETVETAFAFEEELNLRLGPVVVNRTWPTTIPALGPGRGLGLTRAEVAALTSAVQEHRARVDEQEAQIRRLVAALPLDYVRLPERAPDNLSPLSLAASFTDGAP